MLQSIHTTKSPWFVLLFCDNFSCELAPSKLTELSWKDRRKKRKEKEIWKGRDGKIGQGGRKRREGREEKEEDAAHPHRRVNLDQSNVSFLVDVFYLGVVRGSTLQLHLENGEDAIKLTSCSSANFFVKPTSRNPTKTKLRIIEGLSTYMEWS